VERPRPLGLGHVPGLDRRRPDAAGESVGTAPLVPRRRIRLEPVRPLPAGLLAERGPELAEPRIGRREAQPPAFLSLLIRVAQVVVGPVHLVGALEGEAPRAVLGAE